jgi:hypothetical protein
MRSFLSIPAILAVAALVFSGCEMFHVQGQTHMQVTKNGETVSEKTVEFHSLEELPGALKETVGAFSETTAQLIKELTEAPPPGSVKLSALNPSMAKFEGRPDFDFLMQANQEAGMDRFQYVQIGVPSYDMFFKDCAELYALVFQTTQAVARMKALAGQLLQADLSAAADLRGAVDQAINAPTAPATSENMQARTSLQFAGEMASMLSGSFQALAIKVQQLIVSGQQLITAAPTSITNPKTALHLDLIIQGLKESVAMVTESGKLVPDLAGALTGF